MSLYDYILPFSWDRSFYTALDFALFSETGRGHSMHIIMIFIRGETGDFLRTRKVAFQLSLLKTIQVLVRMYSH